MSVREGVFREAAGRVGVMLLTRGEGFSSRDDVFCAAGRQVGEVCGQWLGDRGAVDVRGMSTASISTMVVNARESKGLPSSTHRGALLLLGERTLRPCEFPDKSSTSTGAATREIRWFPQFSYRSYLLAASQASAAPPG